MRSHFLKTFTVLIILVVTSYVSYHLIIRTNSSVGKISASFLEMKEIELVNNGGYPRGKIPLINQKNPPRIFCMVLTSQKNVYTKGMIVMDAWAKNCDNFKLVALLPTNSHDHNTSTSSSTSSSSSSSSTSTNKEYSMYVPLDMEKRHRGDGDHRESSGSRFESENVLQPPGLVNDTYDRLTDKVFLTYKYIAAEYGDYDWYLKADDDTFVFIENLRQFVADKDSSQPVTFGYDFKVIVEGGYHSGGGGYLLSREALSRLGSALKQNYSFCLNSGVEDVDVARCLRRLDVHTQDSIDDFGRERFHPLSIADHYYGNFPDWLYTFAKYSPKKGLDCCSDTSISFHYMNPVSIVMMNQVLAQIQKKNNSTFGVFNFEELIKELNM